MTANAMRKNHPRGSRVVEGADPHLWRLYRNGHRRLPDPFGGSYGGGLVRAVRGCFTANRRKPDLSQGGGKIRWPAGTLGADGSNGGKLLWHCGNADQRPPLLPAVFSPQRIRPFPTQKETGLTLGVALKDIFAFVGTNAVLRML